MKTVITTYITVLMLLFVMHPAIAQDDMPKSSEMRAEKHPLVGAWRMIAHKTIQGDVVTETLKLGDKPSSGYWQTKILTGTHFAFGRQTDDAEDVIAGGGRYSVDGDTYVEIIEYHISSPLVGTKIPFEWRIDEKGFWHHTGTIGDLYLHEVYERLK